MSSDDDDPFAVLGLPATADEATIAAARRRLAKQAHPDAGGSVDAMQRINDAAARALAATNRVPEAAQPPASSRRRRPTPRYRGGAVRHDHPSFTIEALPVEAFEGLLVAGAELGELADDDPPYLLEVLMTSPPAWCRLELVPDAGAVTVSITTARLPGHPTPDVYDIRDVWIDALNRLDWPGPDESPTP